MKMFILVREDLDPSYRMVQGMHAVSELTREAILSEWNKTMVCLLVKNEAELAKWDAKLRVFSKSIWREPDLNNETTSIAVLLEKGSMFKKLKLA